MVLNDRHKIDNSGLGTPVGNKVMLQNKLKLPLALSARNIRIISSGMSNRTSYHFMCLSFFYKKVDGNES